LNVRRLVVTLGLVLCCFLARAEALTPELLGVVYAKDDATSARIAHYYAARRGVPRDNLIGLTVPDKAFISRNELKALRTALLYRLPARVQSLLLIWPRPYAVECMSITTAIAASYEPAFCEPGCGRTKWNPLFNAKEWLPADTIGWLPAMLLPTEDEAFARAVIDRGIRSDGSRPSGMVYLVRTPDALRNVRAALYRDTETLFARNVEIREESTPISTSLPDAIAYFTGAARVEELHEIQFRPGAAADHLTSFGGDLYGSSQMSALAWLRQGATASYGTVSEPCNHLGKFPSPAIFLDHYLRGDTVLEAYWKSVAMPGQGLFIGEPLARPYPQRP
jgi:uncharacterized protein (TIGR03790 family)